jgi:hypothetical protein
VNTQSKQSNPRVWAFWGGVLCLASQVSQLSHMESWGEHAVRNLTELIGMPVIVAFLAFGAARWRNRTSPQVFVPSNEKKTWQQRVLSTLLGVVLLVALIVFMFFVFSRGQDQVLGRDLNGTDIYLGNAAQLTCAQFNALDKVERDGAISWGLGFLSGWHGVYIQRAQQGEGTLPEVAAALIARKVATSTVTRSWPSKFD